MEMSKWVRNVGFTERSMLRGDEGERQGPKSERQGPDGEAGGVVVDKLERKMGKESNHQQPVHSIITLECGALDIHAAR
jgi:hypothetical protein